jgi:hypothetical protein
MVSPALFDIEADGGDRGYDATNGQVLTLRLRTPPPSLTSVLFQVYDPAGFNAELGIAANPPRQSKGAPNLTLVGATSGPAVSPVTLDGDVTVQMPFDGWHSWLVRCVVNGGMRTLPNGKQVIDPTLMHQRMIVVRSPAGRRKIVITETTEYEIDGWPGGLNEVPEGEGEGGGGLPAGSYVGQPVSWNGVEWVPSSTLLVDQISDVNGDGSTLQLGPTASLQSGEQVSISVANGASYSLNLSNHSFGSRNGAGFVVAILRMDLVSDVPRMGFFGDAPAARPSISGVTTQQQLDSLIAALASLGLVTDAR